MWEPIQHPWVRNCSAEELLCSFRPECWFLKSQYVSNFYFEKIIICHVWRKVAGETNPRYQSIFPALECHLSWSSVESVKMHSTVFLRLSHVALPLVQAIIPVEVFFSLTNYQVTKFEAPQHLKGRKRYCNAYRPGVFWPIHDLLSVLKIFSSYQGLRHKHL